LLAGGLHQLYLSLIFAALSCAEYAITALITATSPAMIATSNSGFTGAPFSDAHVALQHIPSKMK